MNNSIIKKRISKQKPNVKISEFDKESSPLPSVEKDKTRSQIVSTTAPIKWNL